jgi:hypothetical protein
MKKQNKIVAFFLLFWSIFATAQEPMVAYRKDGIFHYFDTNGKPLWKPYLDVASFPGGWVNGQLLASSMEIKGDKADNIGVGRRQVLYDKKGKIVFSPKTNRPYRIRTGFDKAGFIQMEDNETGQLLVCNTEGVTVYESQTAKAQYLGDGVVAAIKDSAEVDKEGDVTYILWDIKAKKTLSEIKCASFMGHFDNGVVHPYTSDNSYGILGRDGTLILPMAWGHNDSDYIHGDDDMLCNPLGFICFKDKKEEKWHLFNKKGNDVLGSMSKAILLQKHLFTYKKTDNSKPTSFILKDDKAIEIDSEKYGFAMEMTEGGVLVCKNGEDNVTLLDKNLKALVAFKNVYTCKATTNAFWVNFGGKEDFYECYDEKGKKIGSITAHLLGEPAYNHIPFCNNGKWGLAHESGKVVVKPTDISEKDEVSQPQKGYWEVRKKVGEDKSEFLYYNFQGKLVLKTTSEKDGWDYIVGQEELLYFYRMY